MNNRYTSSVHLPLYNQTLALHIIKTEMVMSDLIEPKPGMAVQLGGVSQYPIHVIVDVFMKRFPRGKGTAGIVRYRRLYAACLTLKIKTSRPRYFMPRERNSLVGLSAMQIEYLAKMTAMVHDEVHGSRTTLNSLFDRGFITGLGDENGKLVQYWLTDKGLEMLGNAQHAHGVSRIQKAVQTQEKAPRDEAYCRSVMKAILRLADEKPTNFVAEAKMLLATIE